MSSPLKRELDGVLRPQKIPGLQAGEDVNTATPYKQIDEPAYANDPDVLAYKALMQKYSPNDDPNNSIGFIAWSWANVLTKLIESCGDELTPENIVAKATTMRNVQSPALLPGITYNTTPTDYAPIKKLRIQIFTGETWTPIRDVSVD